MEIDVDIGEFETTKTQMKSIVDDILNNIEEISKKIEESKLVFDTPSAQAFREHANEYIFNNKRYIDQVLIPMIEKLDNIADNYEEVINIIASEVN